MTFHGRNGALLTALCTAFALAFAGSASAAHDLKIYKAEKHLDLVSDSKAYNLSCDPGDYAVDGMWRIDHGDQDDDDLYPQSIGRAVDVLEAYPTSDDTYHFQFYKNVIGRAQIKVFLTCVGAKTYSADGHDHTLSYTQPTSGAFVAGVANDQAAVFGQDNICPKDTFISGTGFKIDYTPDLDGDPSPYVARMFRSTLSDDGTPQSRLRGWKWSFANGAFTTVDYYAHCLAKKVPAAGTPPEKHKIIYRFQGQGTSATVPQSETLGNGVSTKRISCASHYKAVVAGFELIGGQGSANDPFLAAAGPAYWYLGMDPQPKSRDFRFLNTSSPYADGSAELVAICLNYRTT
jgi:hypothetical protein